MPINQLLINNTSVKPKNAIKYLEDLEKIYFDNLTINKMKIAESYNTIYRLKRIPFLASDDNIGLEELAKTNKYELINIIEKHFSLYKLTDVTLDNNINNGIVLPDYIILRITKILIDLSYSDYVDFIEKCYFALNLVEKKLSLNNENNIYNLDQSDNLIDDYKIIKYLIAERYFKDNYTNAIDKIKEAMCLFEINEESKRNNYVYIEKCASLLASYANE